MFGTRFLPCGAVFLLGLFLACAPPSASEPPGSGVPAERDPSGAATPPSLSKVDAPSTSPEEPGSQDDPFADGVIRTWSLQLAPEDWQTLQDTALEEQYVPANLQIDGVDLGRVGVRYKGSHGTLYRCFDPVTLEQLCAKVSLKIKFDKYVEGKRWKGLKRINLHAVISDPSLMHEKLGYQLFRESGIPAPRSSHGRVFLNGQALGVFAVTEQIDGRFTDNRFPKAPDDNLYKHAWPKTTDWAYFDQRLKTNEDLAQSHQRFIDFARELSTASTPQSRANVLDAFMGLDYLARYMAVDTAIANWDGVTAFKCGTDGTSPCVNHNFYVYEDGYTGRLRLIPWDLDLTFSLTHGIGQSNHGFDAIPAWDDAPADCAARYPIFGGTSMAAAPGCDPFFAGLAHGADPAYRRALAELLEGPFRLEKVLADVDRWAVDLEDAVHADPTLDVNVWRWAVEAFKRDIEVLYLRTSLLRDGQRPVKFGLAATGLNDFESVTGYGLGAGTLLNAGRGQSVRRTLNHQAPLAGAADVRLDFAFRDEPQTPAWGHWALLAFPLQGAPVDLSARTLRIRLGSDATRTVQLELRTAPDATGGEGVARWKVTVPAGGADFALSSADAQLASGSAPQFATVAQVLSQAEVLVVVPLAQGRNADGHFPEGVRDEGWVQIDDLELASF